MKSQAVQEDIQRRFLQNLKNNHTWQLVFVALFTSLLAFFVFIITLIEIEGSNAKRSYQRLVNELYQDMQYIKQEKGLDWLVIENTLSKGVKVSMKQDVFSQQSLFAAGRAKVNPRYMPYINRFVDYLSALDLPAYPKRHQKLIKHLVQPGQQFAVTIRIEGHTDSNPLAKTAMYRNNFELSAFRAYAIMDLLKRYTGLPAEYFAIAGYGSFRPLTDDDTEAVNRRVEIYLVPQVFSAQKAEGSE